MKPRIRIVCTANGTRREAYRIRGAYKCFPKSTNLAADARDFERIEDAAVFLIENAEWGIRMNPGSAIIYRNITIELE